MTDHHRHFSIDDDEPSSTSTDNDEIKSSENDDDERLYLDKEDDGYGTTQIITGDGSNATSVDTNGNEDESDPNHDRTTVLQTYLHILKGNIGPGCLSLPWAMSILGIPLSLATLASLCLITSFNCWAMVRWKRRHASDRRDLSYADLAEIAYGPKFRAYVLVCVCTTQLCVCTVFFSFIGENISAVMKAGGVPFLDDNRVVISIVLPVAMLLSCAPNLRVLAPASTCGLVLLFLAFGCIGIILVRNWQGSDGEELPTLTSHWSEIPLAMCAFLYSYEAINLVLPIEAAMIDPTKFDAVFFYGMATVTAIYAIFACLCVTAFGTIDDGSVTAFLEEHGDEFAAKKLVLVANFIVSCSVLVTYPLQLFPAINLISQLRDRNAHPQHEPTLQSVPLSDSVDDDNGSNLEINGGLDSPDEVSSSTSNFMPLDVGGQEQRLENEFGRESSHFTKQPGGFGATVRGDSPLLRATLVLGTYLLAVLIPNVQELISLSGALAGSSCALIIPPLVELRSIWENHHYLSPMAVLRYMLLVIGVVFLLVGTVFSVRDIVKAFEEGGR